MTRGLIGSVLCLWWAAHPAGAFAQPPSVKAGQEVRLTDGAGRRVAGRASAVAPDAITVDGRRFSFDQIERLERRGDSLWNGLAIGAAVGLLLPLLPSEACFNQSRAGCVASAIETGALLGLAVDAIHRGYTTIYRREDRRAALRLTPHLDRQRRGVEMSLAF